MDSTGTRFLLATSWVDPRDEDAFVTLCWEEGTVGSEVLRLEGIVEVRAYFPPQPARALENRLRGRARGMGVELKRLVVADFHYDPDAWLAKWRANFTGYPIGDTIYVHPPWEPASPAHRVNIEIEPGRAFGTGTHESTQLCLMAMEGLDAPPESVLDVGTGSGILAIGAARLFPGCPVTGLDTDEEAVRSARENVHRNALSRRVRLLAGGVEAVRGRFDLVVANLTEPILRTLAPSLKALARGTLILSGFTQEQMPAVEERFAEDATVARHLDLRGWAALQFAVARASCP